jgi:hypothetical protein
MRNIAEYPITEDEVFEVLRRAEKAATTTPDGDLIIGGIDSFVISRLINFLEWNHVHRNKVMMEMKV